MHKARPLVVLALALAGCATPRQAGLREFEAALARQASATETLTSWCAARRLADPPVIRAVPVKGEAVAPSKEVLVALGVSSQSELGFRHVRLACGEVVLSEARNWYVPARLTPAMNQALQTTQTPFGRVVAPLGYTRDQRPPVRGSGNFCPEGTVVSQQAVLRLADGTPISVVSECYTAAVLGDHSP